MFPRGAKSSLRGHPTGCAQGLAKKERSLAIPSSMIAMRPIDQTLFGFNDGNCFAASVASILELPLAEVPHTFGVNDQFLRWLAARGLAATIVNAAHHVPRGYSIAAGPSLRFAGRLHACVAFNGNVVHDPHYSREGLRLGIVDYVVIHGARGERMWFNGPI